MFNRVVFFFFEQKTAYEMRISDWSSDVCSSDLRSRTNSTKHFNQLASSRKLPSAMPLSRRKRTKACLTRMRRKTPSFRTTTISRSSKTDRKRSVEGKSVSVRVDRGDRRITNKNTSKNESK